MSALEPIMLGVAATLCAALALTAWLAHRRAFALAGDVSRLRAEHEAMAQHQLAIVQEQQRLQANVDDVLAQLARRDARPTRDRRIENAMQIARHGAANAQVLKELGLSDAEAALLLRVHAVEADPQDQASTVADAVEPERRRARQARELAAALAAGG